MLGENPSQHPFAQALTARVLGVTPAEVAEEARQELNEEMASRKAVIMRQRAQGRWGSSDSARKVSKGNA